MSEGDTDRCSRYPFCDKTADLVVPAPDESDYPICRECYEEPCGRCFDAIENDDNVAKGLCQGCRDEIRMWGGDDERGIEKDPDSEQTTLLTDGGTIDDGAEYRNTVTISFITNFEVDPDEFDLRAEKPDTIREELLSAIISGTAKPQMPAAHGETSLKNSREKIRQAHESNTENDSPGGHDEQ